LDWLIENRSPGEVGYSWGNHFAMCGRGGYLPKLKPIIVWTGLIGQAFLDAYEILKLSKYLDVAEGICKWILALPRQKTDSGSCLSYVSFEQWSIHNSNMLGGALLARAGKIVGNEEYMEVGKEAMKYSCTRQLETGAWYYGEAEMHHWIDNFHTGYNLDSLKCYIDNTGDRTFAGNLRRGFEYYKNTFFERDGRPKYYDKRAYPIDIQCASQSIDTLVNFYAVDESALTLARKVADWTIEHMQGEEGYFYYRLLPVLRIKTPMLHWGQATMYKALARLANTLVLR
jgi:rhamnogalacturonyl hydrolase YesR